MKQFLIIPILALCNTIYSQVPRQEQKQEQDAIPVERDYGIEMPPYNKIAPDEVRGVSYEKDGKKSFLMGDETKKGLYDQINFVYDNSCYIVIKGNLYGIANNKGEIIVKIEYDSIGSDNPKEFGFVVKQKGKYGKITKTGEIIIPIKYDRITASNQNVTLVKNKNGETQLIFNEKNKELKNKIDYVELYNNVAIVKSNGKFGVVKNGIVLPFEYDSIFIPLKDPNNIPIGNKKGFQTIKTPNPLIRLHQTISGLTIQMGKKFGLIDSEGSIIYPADNDEIYNSEILGYYSVKKDDFYGIYFFKGKEKKKTQIEFDRISVDGYGAVMASKNKKMGIFNLNGDQIAPFEYDNEFIAQYTGVGFRVSKDKKRGIIDYQGKIVVPLIYDDVSTVSYGNRNFFKVKKDEKYGIVRTGGNIIIPTDFEFIDYLNDNYLVITPQKKVGLYDVNGKLIVPVEYNWITKTAAEKSNILVLNKEDNSFNFLDKNNKIILPENVLEYGYVPNEEKLINPNERSKLLYVKTKNGKFGLLNEIKGTLDVPTTYDQIIQCTRVKENHTYYSVRNGNKFGLINEKNEVLIPIIYDDLDVTFALSTSYFNEQKENKNKSNDLQFVVAKGKKYGTVNLKNEVVIPFQYSFLQRISAIGLFKAKTGKQYQIIDEDGKIINNNTFDEVANFERINDNGDNENLLFTSLTFSNGKMRVIDSKGNFISTDKPMQPHVGFETFDELKLALIKALDSKEDVLLQEFVNKIAPSEHILYYLKQNLFDKSKLSTNVDFVKDKYLHDLLKFKKNLWNGDKNLSWRYNRSSLNVIDYTGYSERYGIVKNTRTSDQSYGDTRFMEKLLRDAVKVNGYWISTYFMKRGFDRY